MKHLQSFRLFEARASRLPSGLTPRQGAFLNEFTQGTWSVNPETGLVDVSGDFDCSGRGFKSLKGVSFGQVSGYFYCANNRLTTLVGAPQTVGGDFSCGDNQLTTLEGAPQTVDGNFLCYGNELSTLEGAPRTVGVDFLCHRNQLTSLEGAPQTIGNKFFCYSNRLTSLAGAPQTVDGNFDCSYNQLTTLAGAPQTVGGYFDCDNNDLTSLVGAPQTVGGSFDCDAFLLQQGKWNPAGWGKILSTGGDAARRLILTLPFFQPDWWNSELQRDPGNTVHLLAQAWKHLPEDLKSGIVIPPGYEDEFGLFSDFDDLGLF